MKSVYCIHPDINDVISLIDYLGLPESYAKILTWEPHEPSFLFVSEHVYLNPKFFKEFCKYSACSKTIYIFMAGECISPDMNLFDYAITFDRKLKDEDRICRFPPSVLHRSSILSSKNDLNEDTARKILSDKKGFCCFLYSNPNAHPMRDALFHEISKYKKVDSLGRHLHNTPLPSSRNASNWRELSIELKSAYKFSIASENAAYEGYTSEKLYSSFQAHTVPIYWGNPYVREEFNKDAFIDCSEFDNIKDLIDRIKMIDDNDDLWIQMILQPWQTEEQQRETEKEIERYYKFIEHIFEQDFREARRIPEGTYPSRYREFFRRSPSLKTTIKYSKVITIVDKLKKPLIRFVRRKRKRN